MKKYAIILATLGLAFSLHAQTVPLFINYQGKITGGTGAPLGATGTAPNFTAAPINRKVIFRIFDAQSAGTRLWSEQQTVTIALGEFSVLLGQGIDAVYAGTTETRPAMDTVFNGPVPPPTANRYLEIVVDDGSGTFTAADVAITPRQRITSTAFSLRAKLAETVPDSAITANAIAAGAVTAIKISDNAITNVKIANLSILNEDLAPNSVTTDEIANLTVATADLADDAVTAAKLDPAIGIWSVNAANVYRPAGSVGIGKVPAVALDVVGAITATGNITTAGALTGGSITSTGPFTATTITATTGMNIEDNGIMQLGLGVLGREGSAGKIGYQTFSDAVDIVGAGTTGANRKIKMWAEGGTVFTGNVGIGTNNPGVRLDVAGTTSLIMAETRYNSYSIRSLGGGLYAVDPGFIPTNQAFNYEGIDWLSTLGTQYIGIGDRLQAPVSIRSEGWIATMMGMVVYSDSRIKRDVRASAPAKDLAAIQQLQVTDYRMVDPSSGGDGWRKGFIAQEVEKVMPGAVTRSVEFVPDIFSLATAVVWNPGAKTLSLTLSKDHDLKPGERVRLHVDGSRLDLDVNAVPSAREFVVEKCGQAPEKVFVYGRQVNDFRTVDYDRIFTTSVGALQELKKEKDAEVKALQEENASLRDRLAALEVNDKTRDAKLAAIEKLLLSPGKSAARTVSLNAGE